MDEADDDEPFPVLQVLLDMFVFIHQMSVKQGLSMLDIENLHIGLINIYLKIGN